MAAFDPATLDRWRALAIVDRDGTTVGTISEFYLDRETGYPTWALVDTGLFGATQTFVPLVHATEIGDGLQVPYEKRHIKDTPRVDLHDELSPGEEATLFAHYGVDYQPSPESSDAEQVEAAEAESAEPVAPEPGSVEGSEPVPPEAEAVPLEPASVEDPGAAPEESGSVEGPGVVSPLGSVEGPGPLPAEAGSVAPEAGPVEGPGPVPNEAGTAGLVEGQDGPAATGATGLDPAEPGTFATTEPGFGPGSAEATGGVPDEPRTASPDDPTLVAPGGLGSAPEHYDEHPAGPDAPEHAHVEPSALPDLSQPAPADPDLSQPAPADPDLSQPAPADPDLSQPAPADPDLSRPMPTDPDLYRPAPADPDLSRTAPVEPGLPGSTAASPGPVPTTAGKDDGGDPASHPADNAPLPTSEEAAWPPGFDPNEPADHSAGSDRWREAKLAAERNRIARAPAAQPEERSPLERARRRLERLVGVGQDHPDPDDFSPADREAAERARRARLGLEDDDPRRR